MYPMCHFSPWHSVFRVGVPILFTSFSETPFFPDRFAGDETFFFCLTRSVSKVFCSPSPPTQPTFLRLGLYFSVKPGFPLPPSVLVFFDFLRPFQHLWRLGGCGRVASDLKKRPCTFLPGSFGRRPIVNHCQCRPRPCFSGLSTPGA